MAKAYDYALMHVFESTCESIEQYRRRHSNGGALFFARVDEEVSALTATSEVRLTLQDLDVAEELKNYCNGFLEENVGEMPSS